jgi:hypothetical protein
MNLYLTHSILNRGFFDVVPSPSTVLGVNSVRNLFARAEPGYFLAEITIHFFEAVYWRHPLDSTSKI